MARPLRVLLIEDNDDDALLLARELQRAGFEPEMDRVQDRDGMAAALDRGGHDCIISDYRLPRFSAPEALRLYKERGLDTPFLVCSGSIGEPQAIELLKGGANDFFLKSSLMRLGAAVERELREAESRRALRRAEAERERVGQELAEREAFLRQVIDLNPNLIFVKDREGRFALANRAVAEAYGTTVEGLVGKTDAEFNRDAEQVRHFRDDDVAVMDSGREKMVPEELLTDAHGSPRWLQTVKRPLFGPDGRADRVLGVATDVTYLKLAEQALRESEERARLLVERTHEYAIFMLSAEGRVITWNVGAERLIGYHPSEILGEPVARLFSREDVAAGKAERLSSAALVRGEAEDEGWRVRKDGSRFWANVVVTALHDSDDRLRGFGTVIRDATERKRSTEALQQSEERLRQVVEAAPNGILATDAAGTIVLVNQQIEQLFGYSRSELLGRPVEQLVPEALRSSHVADREAFGRSPGGRRMAGGRELTCERKDGSTFPAEIGLIQFDSGEGPMALATVVDTTERRALEGRLQQAQKMEAIGRLAGGVAHDFNNILGIIAGFGGLAQRQLPADHPVQSRLEQILNAAGRAAELTRQMLAFSRKQVMHPRALNLNEVVESTRAMLARLIGEDVELIARLDHDIGTVMADPTQIDQVLMNLAVNARDAMPTGGTLTFETANVDLDADYVRRHGAGKVGSFVMLSVSDTGIGMDEATRSHIFEPFFTTKPEGKGTGLGLATVYGIVKQSGGFIWAYSEVAHGATFKIYLPRVDVVQEHVPPAEASGAVPGGTETILVVEDQPALLEMIREVLEQQGYTVLAAADGVAALELAHRYQGPLGLLLTDVVMPGMNGRELAERLATVRPGIRALYMSGYSNSTVSDRGLLIGDVSLIEKPFTATALAHAVRRALGRE